MTYAADTDRTQQETDVTVPAAPQPHTQTYAVSGMTCGHCVASVTEELGEVDGVRAVDVDLVAGGTSTVTVTSDRALDEAVVGAAVGEAGYQLA